jgi:hypothetical protein
MEADNASSLRVVLLVTRMSMLGFLATVCNEAGEASDTPSHLSLTE